MTLSHTCCSKFDLSWGFVCFFLQFFVRKQIAIEGQHNICRTSWRWSSALPNRIGQDQNQAVNVCSRAFFSFSLLTRVLRHESTSAHTDCTEEACGVSSLHFNNSIYAQKGEDIWLSNPIFRMRESWTTAITGELHLNHLRWIIEFHLF